MYSQESQVGNHLPNFIFCHMLKGRWIMPGCQHKIHVNAQDYRLFQQVTAYNGMVGIVNEYQGTEQNPSNGRCYRAGCLAKVINIKENTHANSYNIELQGQCRFHILNLMQNEVLENTQYQVDYSNFTHDLHSSFTPKVRDMSNPSLLGTFERFLNGIGLQCMLNVIMDMPVQILINKIIMVFPLSSSEKQSLLEISDPKMQQDVLSMLMDIHEQGRDQKNTPTLH